ncbi:uncharacterized protein LOC132696763 isoform X2 [Cylas formicarius]|uniref:uncharacterized protein LOC132696763 isoform X2 n=1 Tax=Cylas formicarius TaxID=197179 RepID=UPI002958A79B|nr:uncharacterized protein LOC132696763 isoform X2 [Cylas formicarius]
MKGNSIKLSIITLLMLSLIPWPGPTIFKISCPRDRARIVRKVVQAKWIPILAKYKLHLPLECPFHHQRDIFGPQQLAKKQHRPSQWTCGFCGKSFFEERYLDMHFDIRHKTHINMAEDAVCLADYCDIMRCEVLNTQDLRTILDHKNTDVEIWHKTTLHSKALISPGSRDVANYDIKSESFKYLQKKNDLLNGKQQCQRSKNVARNNESNLNENDKLKHGKEANNVCRMDLVDSALPAPDGNHQRIDNWQKKLKADCKPEELQKIKTKCEILVRHCIANLLIHLSFKDFQEVEDDFNRAVCWYLTCDRYWEDSQTDIRSFPWGLVCMIIMVLSLGICLCYYIVWVLFDTDDISVTSTSLTDRSTPSPTHLHGQNLGATDGHHIFTEDFITSDKDNEYIYVTYPPELKRRLLESCYNRTTRL